LYADEPKATKVIPPQGYSVLSAGATVGSIPNNSKIEVKAAADSIESNAAGAFVLVGQARITITADGAELANYQGAELILVPISRAAQLVTQERGQALIKQLDDATTKRDLPALQAIFAPNAKITVELFDPKGLVTKNFTPPEYADHLRALFPQAYHHAIRYRISNLVIAKDGLTAMAWARLVDQYQFPQGNAEFERERKVELAQSDKGLVITSLALTFSQNSLRATTPPAPAAPPQPPRTRDREIRN
jgi:hypothetical protein